MIRALAWLSLYLGLVLLPPALLVAVEPPRSGGLAWDFAMVLGYSALAMFGLQFVLTARFKRATAPFGIDWIYALHRWLAIAALLFVVLHVAILAWRHPAALGVADPFRAPWHMSAGRLALILFALVVLTSLLRKRLRWAYESWRFWHGIAAVAALLLAIAHAEGAGHFLNARWKRWAWGGLAAAWLLAIVHVRLLRPWRVARRPWAIASLKRLAGRTWRLRLRPIGHPGLGDFLPGQFAWLSFGSHPIRLKEHPFSIASAPGAEQLEFAIKELGDFTSRIGELPLDTRVYVDGPYGSFTIDHHPEAQGLIFIAGGAGIAPILSMLRAMAARHDRRPALLFYGNRSLSRTAFREELTSLESRIALRVVLVLHEPEPEWEGERGFIDAELLRRHLGAGREGWHAFICGPKPMIALAERSLHRLGIPLRAIHSEIFDLA